MSSTPVDRSGRVALWLHLAATGLVLTTLMALLPDLPTVPVHSGVPAPDGIGRRDDIAPSLPVAMAPVDADPVPLRVVADVSRLPDPHGAEQGAEHGAEHGDPNVTHSAQHGKPAHPKHPEHPEHPETPHGRKGSPRGK